MRNDSIIMDQPNKMHPVCLGCISHEKCYNRDEDELGPLCHNGSVFRDQSIKSHDRPRNIGVLPGADGGLIFVELGKNIIS